MDRVDSNKNSTGNIHRSHDISPKVDTELQLVLPVSRLAFETVLNEVSVSVLSLYNTGNVSIFFEWERRDKHNPFSV